MSQLGHDGLWAWCPLGLARAEPQGISVVTTRSVTPSLHQGMPRAHRVATATPSEINPNSTGQRRDHPLLPLATAHIVCTVSPWETSQKGRKMPKSPEFQQKGGAQAPPGGLVLVVTAADSCVSLCPPFSCVPALASSPFQG